MTMSILTFKGSFGSGNRKVNVYNSFVHFIQWIALIVSSQTYKDKEGMFSICRELHLLGQTGHDSSGMGRKSA